MIELAVPPVRLAAAAALSLAWLGLCLACWRRTQPVKVADGQWTVAYASQTGMAEVLARQTADRLGKGCVVVPLSALPVTGLMRDGRFLFVVATAGDGEAPDQGRLFEQHLAALTSRLSCRYAVLALGDRRYPDYCAFGRRLDEGLASAGAQRLFPRIEVNAGAAEAIGRWFAQFGGQAEQAGMPQAEPWILQRREHLNPGSPGGGVYRLTLVPANRERPHWVSGDLARIFLPEWDGPRDYSIASVPAEGALQLLVRQQRNAAGEPGLASGFLTSELQIGDRLPVCLRPHGPFRLGDNHARPLILIGNGVGMAGLLAHLKARIAAGVSENWLIFGERSPAVDLHCGELLQDWVDAAQLRLDVAFSRCPQTPAYVQQQVLAGERVIRAWVKRGAAIYVCGSRRGMGVAVEAALTTVLGADGVAMLLASGRYRRDVF